LVSIYIESAVGLFSAISVFKTHNVVLFQVIARLYLDQFDLDGVRVFQAMPGTLLDES
jgi:hypothetical protein